MIRRICSLCKGEGEHRRNPGWPDPQEEISETCRACAGTGQVPLPPVEQVETLRAGISWVRGMCSDGEPLEAIDAKLGEVLRDAA